MLFHLKGSALDWFQSAVTHRASSVTSVTWLSSSAAFTNELQRLSGPCNPTNNAIIHLEKLKYKDLGKAVKYSLDFNCDAPWTSWNDSALYRQFYKGLPDRLKDRLARIGKPPTLILLQHQIQILDQCHWEHQSEISCNKRATTSTAPTQSDNSKLLTSASGSNNNKAATTTLQPLTQKMSTSSSSCKICANKLRVVGSGQIDRSGHGGIGIVHQVLVLAHESRTPILGVRLEVWVKCKCLNKAGMN